MHELHGYKVKRLKKIWTRLIDEESAVLIRIRLNLKTSTYKVEDAFDGTMNDAKMLMGKHLAIDTRHRKKEEKRCQDVKMRHRSNSTPRIYERKKDIGEGNPLFKRTRT